MNTYGYVGGDPTSHGDPLGLLEIFIGGAGENPTQGIVRNYQQAFAQTFPNRSSQYFQWGQQSAIMQAVIAALANDPCEPINLIGHSYGGATAANTAKALSKQGVNVTNVVTIDPVSRWWSRSNAGNTQNWINVLATNKTPGGSWGNFVAWLGGKWGKWPYGAGANNFYTTPYNHQQFSQMFNYAPPGGVSALQTILGTKSGCQQCQP